MRKSANDRPPPIVLQPPNWIGDLCLFQDYTVRTSTVVALTHAELLTVWKEAIDTLVNEFPQAQKAYDDFRQLVEEMGDKATRCAHCGAPGHTIAHCQQLETE